MKIFQLSNTNHSQDLHPHLHLQIQEFCLLSRQSFLWQVRFQGAGRYDEQPLHIFHLFGWLIAWPTCRWPRLNLGGFHQKFLQWLERNWSPPIDKGPSTLLVHLLSVPLISRASWFLCCFLHKLILHRTDHTNVDGSVPSICPDWDEHICWLLIWSREKGVLFFCWWQRGRLSNWVHCISNDIVPIDPFTLMPTSNCMIAEVVTEVLINFFLFD